MAGNQTRPILTITSPVGKKILTGEGDFKEYKPAPTIYSSSDRSFFFAVLYTFVDGDGHDFKSSQVQILDGNKIVWDSREDKINDKVLLGSGLIPSVSPGHMVIPDEGKLKPGIIYGVRARARDDFEIRRWELMSDWSEVKYFELTSDNKAWIVEE